jgi:hypothetical protein
MSDEMITRDIEATPEQDQRALRMLALLTMTANTLQEVQRSSLPGGNMVAGAMAVSKFLLLLTEEHHTGDALLAEVKAFAIDIGFTIREHSGLVN